MNKLFFFVFLTLLIKASEPPLVDPAAKKIVDHMLFEPTGTQLVLAQETKLPVTPPRIVSRRQSLPDCVLPEKLPKSPPIMPPALQSTESVKLKTGLTVPATQQPSIAFNNVKMATLGIVIWANEKRSEERWNAMLEKYRQLENEPFDQKALLHTIIDEIDLSTNKTGNGVWGGLSFTYVKDSQKVDNKKAPEQP